MYTLINNYHKTMRENEIELIDRESSISRRDAFKEIWSLVLGFSAAAFSLTSEVEAGNTKREKEGVEFPENGVVNISKSDGIIYYSLNNSRKDISLEMLEYSEESVNTAKNDKNIAWKYAIFQVKEGILKVKVTKSPEEVVTYKLSIVEGDEVREVTFNIIPEGGEVLPPQEVSITTSWPIVSGENTDDILAENGPHIPVEISLSVNSPYTLSSNSLTFNPINEWEIETQTVNILNNWQIVWNKSVTVTWQ